jgi:hypothetical protein
MSLYRSVSLQIKAEKALEEEKTNVRIAALQHLRSEFCDLIDELIIREEQTLQDSDNDAEP